MARSTDRIINRAWSEMMTKLQEFLLSISRPKELVGTGFPKYEDMTEEEKRAIDNLKKAVDEAISVFAKYEGV